MKQQISPKQVAKAIGVSESSLKRWCDQGLIEMTRTAGGHRRLAVDDVIQFLRSSGHNLVEPALLGLLATVGRGAKVLAQARQQMRDALLAGNEDLCRTIVFDLHLAGQSACQICDRVLTAAFHEIGDRWQCGEAQVYQERRACETCSRVLAELRSAIPEPPATALLAIGGTPECDPYTLPTTMAELVLRQSGWRAQSLGSRLPFSTLAAAVRDMRPKVFWLSVSHLEEPDQFVEQYQRFYEEVRQTVAIVVGGRGLGEPVRRRMRYAAFCDNLEHLEAFAASIVEASTRATSSSELVRTSTVRSRSARRRS